VTSPITQGLHRSVRAVVWQVLAVAVVALAWSAKGGAWALAAALGGAAATLGGWLFARVALGGGIGAAGRALNRLLLGIGLKWGTVLAALAACLALGLPALALLVGTIAAVVTHTLVMFGQTQANQHNA